MTPGLPVDRQRHALQPAIDRLRSKVGRDRAETILTAEVGGTPSEVVYEENKLELRHYEPETQRYGTPILLVYALVNRPYVLDLQPDRSVIRRLTEAGFDVYLIDWGTPSRLDRSLTIADYVCRYIDNCVEAVRQAADAPDVHLLGYCMGGTMAVAYTCLNPDPVRTLSLLATPVAFDGTGGLLERWAKHCDPDLMAETLGNIPGDLLSAAFSLLDPVDQSLGKYLRLYDNLDDEAFVATFARMERWIRDGVALPGGVFREFVRDLYRENRLVEGRYSLEDDPVRPGDIEVPLLQVVGAHDHIVPPESSTPLNDLVASTDERLIEFPRGHIGVSVSAAAHEDLWPEVCAWYAARDAQTPDGTARAQRRVQAVAAQAGAAARAAQDGGLRSVAPDVRTVDGIGPTYATRLRAAGIETTADLRARGIEAAAEVTGAPQNRVEGWLAQVS